MGDRFFSKILYGAESAPGTAVPATNMLAGSKVSAISVDRKPRVISENIGVRAEGSRMVSDQFLVTEA